MLREYLLSLGYTDEDIKKIRNTYPVYKCGEEALYQNIKSLYEFFVSFGYATEQILKMTIERPQIFCFNLEIIKHFSDKNVDMDK